MNKYLGETTLKSLENTPYAKFTASDWAMEFLSNYGQIDGSHHKTWVLDQIARILNGTKVIVKLAKWEDGQKEYRCSTDKPSKKYRDWVKEMRVIDRDGSLIYNYDKGIAP